MILLLGGRGYVGLAYQTYLKQRGLPHRVLSREDVLWDKPLDASATLKAANASFLINCAGYTGKPNVDACELHKRECLYGNAVLPGLIDKACQAADVPWGHVSSGCIYTGSRPDGSGFLEEDRPNFSFRTNNCSFYSGTKALGEEILAYSPQCYIWRLRIPFNEIDNPRNYLTKVMRYDTLLEARNSLSQLQDFVRATFECFEKRVPFGIYNVTNPGSVTTSEVVGMIEKSGVCPKPFKFFKDETEFMSRAAKTPRSNCVLDSSKILATGIQLRPVQETVEIALQNWKKS
jgi:dTDP-4-dehydrorhamnose reductase